MLSKKAAYNFLSLEVYNPFDFQPVVQSLLFLTLTITLWLINKHFLETIITKKAFAKKIS